MSHQSSGVETQGDVYSICGGGIEGTALIEQLQQRLSQQDQATRRRDGKCQNRLHRLAQGTAQAGQVFACGQVCQGGECYQSKCRADDGFRQLHGVPPPLQCAHAAGAKPRGQIGGSKNGEVEDTKVEHPGAHQHHNPPYSRAVQVNYRPPAETVMRQPRYFDSQMQCSSDNGANRQPANSPHWGQPQRPCHNAQRIDDGGQCW